MKANRGPFAAIILILLLIASIYGGYFLMRTEDRPMPSPLPASSGPRLVMSIDGFRFIRSENGWVSWMVDAGSAELYENKQAKMEDVEIVFKQAGGDNKEAVLRGDHATMDTANGNASIRRGADNVRVLTSDGYLLTTDSLHWQAGARRVWTADAFRLLGSEVFLEGVGFSANVNMRTIEVKDHVRAVLQN